MAVELRHRSWSDEPVATFELLETFGAAWTQIDEPKFKSSIRQDLRPNVRSFYYLRLHGRNAAEWWKHEKSEDRYNYLYSADELKPFAEAAGEASRVGQEGVSLRQQSLLGQGRGQCGHPQTSTRTAAARRVPGGIRRALSRPEGAREVAAAVAHSLTEAFLSTSVF